MKLELRTAFILILGLCSIQQIEGLRPDYKELEDGYEDYRNHIWEFLLKNPCDERFTWAEPANFRCNAYVQSFRRLPKVEQGNCAYATEGICDWTNRVCVVVIPIVSVTFRDDGTLTPIEDEARKKKVPLRTCAQHIEGYDEAIKMIKKERVPSRKPPMRKFRQCIGLTQSQRSRQHRHDYGAGSRSSVLSSGKVNSPQKVFDGPTERENTENWEN